jgi:hypothetical protein
LLVILDRPVAPFRWSGRPNREGHMCSLDLVLLVSHVVERLRSRPAKTPSLPLFPNATPHLPLEAEIALLSADLFHLPLDDPLPLSETALDPGLLLDEVDPLPLYPLPLEPEAGARLPSDDDEALPPFDDAALLPHDDEEASRPCLEEGGVRPARLPPEGGDTRAMTRGEGVEAGAIAGATRGV